MSSYMTVDLFRVGDVVAPTYGRLCGVRGVVSQILSTAYGHQLILIRFDDPVRKYADQSSRLEWAYEPSNVRLEAFAVAGRGVDVEGAA